MRELPHGVIRQIPHTKVPAAFRYMQQFAKQGRRRLLRSRSIASAGHSTSFHLVSQKRKPNQRSRAIFSASTTKYAAGALSPTKFTDPTPPLSCRCSNRRGGGGGGGGTPCVTPGGGEGTVPGFLICRHWYTTSLHSWAIFCAASHLSEAPQFAPTVTDWTVSNNAETFAIHNWAQRTQSCSTVQPSQRQRFDHLSSLRGA